MTVLFNTLGWGWDYYSSHEPWDFNTKSERDPRFSRSKRTTRKKSKTTTTSVVYNSGESQQNYIHTSSLEKTTRHSIGIGTYSSRLVRPIRTSTTRKTRKPTNRRQSKPNRIKTTMRRKTRRPTSNKYNHEDSKQQNYSYSSSLEKSTRHRIVNRTKSRPKTLDPIPKSTYSAVNIHIIPPNTFKPRNEYSMYPETLGRTTTKRSFINGFYNDIKNIWSGAYFYPTGVNHIVTKVLSQDYNQETSKSCSRCTTEKQNETEKHLGFWSKIKKTLASKFKLNTKKKSKPGHKIEKLKLNKPSVIPTVSNGVSSEKETTDSKVKMKAKFAEVENAIDIKSPIKCTTKVPLPRRK